jgi:organic radical activating enzyme
MPRLDNETDLEYKQRVIDPLSASFCAAKWYNATIWLGSGQTTSCHHPPAHAIDISAIAKNPKALHNTVQKKEDRRLMQAGERPRGCEYCWKIEDMDRNAVSDRVYKTVIYQDKDIQDANNLDHTHDVDLKTLEIAFDRTCQFACSYCNPAFSSTWVKDIRINGPYTGLQSDGRNHFTHPHNHSQLYKFTEANPYVEAFFKWWESDLHKTLDELRITGGEPLLSGHTWKLLDWFKTNQGRSNTRLAINSNLGQDVDIDRLLESVQGIEFDLYTSNESMPAQAEYIRDGLDYKLWIDNVVRLANSGQVRGLHVMCTVNALCLESLPEFLTELLALKSTWGRDFPNFTLNILRFPSFQSPLVLPDELREYHKQRLETWLNTWNKHVMLHEHERNHVQRLIDYLDVVKTPHSEAFELDQLRNDFKRFYEQYDKRRGKEFGPTFPSMKEWYDSIS